MLDSVWLGAFGAGWLWIVLVEPGFDFGEDVAALFGKPREMGRTRIGDHADGFAALGEKNEKFAALETGNSNVRLAMENQQRRSDLVRVHDSGKYQERLGTLFLKAHVVIDLAYVAGGNKAEPINDAGSFDGSFVAVRLRDGPGSHEATGAPAEDGLAVGIGPALRYGEIGGAVDVAVGAVAKMLIDGLEELSAVAC